MQITTARIRVSGSAIERTCPVTRVSLDGVFVRGLRGVVPDERVRVTIQLGESSVETPGVIRHLIDAREASARRCAPGVSVVWEDPTPELLSLLDEVVDGDESVKSPLEEGLVTSFNKVMRAGRTKDGLAVAKQLLGVNNASRYQLAYEMAHGLVSRQAGDEERAQECFARALALDPTCQQAAILQRRIAPDATDAPAHPIPSVDVPPIQVRRHPRVPMKIPTQLRRNKKLVRVTANDLSVGGVFVPSLSTPPVGTLLEVTLRLPGSRELVRTRAKVARVVTQAQAQRNGGRPGMGLQFLGLAPHQQDELQRAVDAVPHAAAG